MKNKMTDNKEMTTEQIKNFRKVLLAQFGPYALIMPDSEVIDHRDKMQHMFDETEEI